MIVWSIVIGLHQFEKASHMRSLPAHRRRPMVDRQATLPGLWDILQADLLAARQEEADIRPVRRPEVLEAQAGAEHTLDPVQAIPAEDRTRAEFGTSEPSARI
jgi:hypothetical protein